VVKVFRHEIAMNLGRILLFGFVKISRFHRTLKTNVLGLRSVLADHHILSGKLADRPALDIQLLMQEEI
jgi:hypothetical protein